MPQPDMLPRGYRRDRAGCTTMGGNFMAGLTATGRLSGTERGALHVTLWGAVAVAVIAWCLAGVQIYGFWVGDPVLSVSLLNSFFPEIGEDSPGVLAGQYETASLTVSYIPLPARLMLTCAALLRHLPVVAICLATAFLCRQLLRYRPLAKLPRRPWAGLHRSLPRRRATRNSGIRRHGHVGPGAGPARTDSLASARL